jgi:subtilisin-like proprotein convertase family protein
MNRSPRRATTPCQIKILLGTLAGIIVAATSTWAGGEWFTSRTVQGQSRPVGVLRDTASELLDATVTPEKVTFTATGLPLNIPDNDNNGVTATLPVNYPGQAAGLSISYHITHTYIGDLKVTLIGPSGASYVVYDRTGGSSNNLTVIDLSVAAATSETASGVWRLLVQDLAGADIGTLDTWSLSISSTTKAVIDLVISLSANPQGDDDGNHQGQPNSAAQDNWERIVQHFADGVYESTNAAHRIRNVRLFRSGRSAATADILWTSAGHPHVPSKGGVGEAGGHINMYETFIGGGAGGANYAMLADESGSGYTQTHEWGHYFYGVYDEYKRTNSPTDVPVVPSIMNSQWAARGGDFRWLNFSIKNIGGGEFQNTLHNRQHDEHGASAWETLARPTSQDIKTAAQLSLGKRIYYPEVAAGAPAANTTPLIELPGLARAALNIIWMSDQDVFEIIIDHSGSMSDENKMEQAKTAAKLLINLLPLGKSRVGVIEFSDSVNEIQPIIPLNTQADKDSVKARITAITPIGNTAIGDAAQVGLQKILAPALARSNRVVFLLSDGISNTGIDPLSVIPSYQNAQIPLFTFGFGSDADLPTLQQLALLTGGKFYSSPASLAAIIAAFHDAQNVASSIPSLTANTLLLGSGSGTGSFTVDSTIGQLNLSLVKPASIPAGQVQLRDANGNPVTPTDTITVGNEVLLSHTVLNPGPGTWSVVTPGGGSGAAVTYTASGIPSTLTYTAQVVSVGGATVNYPAPIKLRARLFKETAISRATVSAQAIAPNGAVEAIQFHDDGANGDDVAGDGNYTVVYSYNQTGTYTFKVNYIAAAGQAFATYNGATRSATIEGLEPPPIPDQPITEAFSRANQIQVKTLGGALVNISTRMRVEPGSNVLIAGFIITGTEPKKVIVRGIGPSLAGFGVADALADPILELRNSSGQLVSSNNDWETSPDRQAIIDSQLAPRNPRESAILMTLGPGAYTAILQGVNNTTGIGLVELYDLDQSVDSKLANISTRGLVQTGENVMIGGIIVSGIGPIKAVVRAIGPSLTAFGVQGALADPVLELRNSNGALIVTNDDWQSGANVTELQGNGLAPTNPLESALIGSFSPGAYTAIVRGFNDLTGVGLVEVYQVGN